MAVKASAMISIFNVDDGDDGKGISSTAVTYQAGSSQTTTPTGSWSSSVPTLTTALPYLWTRTAITYTDGTTSTSYSVGSTLESFEVGGRNLLLDSTTGYSNDPSDYLCAVFYTTEEFVEGEEYTIQVNATTSAERTAINAYVGGGSYSVGSWTKTVGEGTATYTWTFTATANMVSAPDYVNVYSSTTGAGQGSTEISGTCTVNWIKLEKGNKATDWTPAPEDITEEISSAQEELSDKIAEVKSDAQLEIDSLNAMISSLVVDENGESMMTQTSDGWQFDMSGVINNVATIDTTLNTTNENLTSLASNFNNLVQTVAGLSTLTAYVRIGQDDDGNPYIELGADGSSFKVRITNTDIKFYDGTSIPAYISNQSLNIDSAIVDDSIQFGDHMMKIRSNGNLGISWKG